MKKFLTIFFTLFVSVFLFNNKVEAKYYDNTGTNAILSGSKKTINNKIGDKYTYKINNSSFNETISIEYKTNGIYFNSDYIKNIPIFETNDLNLLLKSVFLIVYSPEYSQLIVYVFNHSNMANNVYFDFVNETSDNKFDFYSTKVDLITNGITANRIKFSYSVNHSYSSQSSNQNNAYASFKWSVYGTNASIKTNKGNYYIEDLAPKINSLEFKEDIIKKNSYVASNYVLTIDNYSEDYNYYFAYSSCINNNSCYNLTQLNTKSKYYDNLGSYNYQEDYLLNINGLIEENGKINISLFTNDTILILINDKNGNFIESQTFTITEIDEKKTSINKTPYFTVENYTSDSCKIYENETEYKLCTSFEIYINDMSNVHDYILYESLNSADNFKEIGIWNNSASITLYKNGDYAIYKLTDLEGNIIDTITVNAGGLNIFNENDNEVYFKHETNYNEDTKNAVVRYYFYNYKFDNYKIYYSEDGLCSEFNEITLNYENDIVGSIQKTYKENKTICFKITDLEGNYIKSFTYNLDYFLIIENDENYTTFDYMFDYMKELAKNSTKIFMYMTNVYNKIINSNLGSYVILVIFTCIVILILKALSR